MRKKVSLANLKNLELRLSGLMTEEVNTQLQLFGPNEIVEVSGSALKEIALETLKDPMIWFLVIIGSIYLLVGEMTDGIVLLMSIMPLVLMDAFLHWRTSSSTSALKGNLATHATVRRNGKVSIIDSLGLVPGDLVQLKANETLPADGLFIESQSLQIDESALTGEALPISKHVFLPDLRGGPSEVSIDENNLGYTGTRVLAGSGVLLVLETGKQTQYAQIVQSVSEVPHERTPLQIAIARLVRVLLGGALVFCLILAAIRYYQGKGLLDALLSAATLAVAAIPEEFPLVFTFFLGVGVYRLARKHTLVRRAVSVENIGRINRICTDKTGTITLGQLRLTHILPGHDQKEEFVLKCAFAAAGSRDFDPVDRAIHEHPGGKVTAGKQERIFPFTEDRKRESGIFSEGSKLYCYTKGAPESIFSLSSFGPNEKEHWRNETSKLAREGHKVLACAYAPVETTAEEPVSGFIFSGLLAFEDPPRPEVAGAMKYCHDHNIKVTMITGDHPETAEAIAREVNLSPGPLRVISMEESPEKFEGEFLKDINVIARCKPLQKQRIVEALKATGELVAVTGDGVNDVPALKSADISLAMGARGTRSAKEVSHMVITDDNFSTIVDAVVEGRILFQNMKKSFEYLLLFHVPFVLTAAIIPLLGYPLLYLPAQIVWLELIIHPTALFAFQGKRAVEGKPDNSFFIKRDLFIIGGIGLAFTLVLIINYMTALKEVADLGHARARIMVMLTFWSASLVLVLGDLRSLAVRTILALTLGTSLVLIQWPFASSLLHLSPIHFKDWSVLSISVVIFALIFKWVRNE